VPSVLLKKKLVSKEYTGTLKKVKVKVSRYTPWRHMGGEEV
jgi:hypothetical protein